MSKFILIEEFHLVVFAHRGLPEAEYDAVRQTVDDKGFQAAVRKAVRLVVQQFPALGKVRITLTR